MTPGTIYVQAFRESLRIPGIRHQEVRDRAQSAVNRYSEARTRETLRRAHRTDLRAIVGEYGSGHPVGRAALDILRGA